MATIYWQIDDTSAWTRGFALGVSGRTPVDPGDFVSTVDPKGIKFCQYEY